MLKSIKSYFFSVAEVDKKGETVSTMKPTESKPSFFGQTVKFQGDDEQHSTEITSDDVTIIPSAGTHDKGSSNVKTKNIVDHSWDLRFYKGQLLAVHISGKFIAFGLKVMGKSESMVRIVNRVNSHRYLCKGMTGFVQDIAFAHISSQVLLGIVDEAGTLFVYRIEDSPDALQTKLVLRISQSNDLKSAVSVRRLIWCPYIPEEDGDEAKDPDSDEIATMLVVTHGPKAEIWSVRMVVGAYGTDKELCSADVKDGLLTLNEHTQDIVDAAFSPDGTALATASLDGYVKFFQVYMQGSGTPRCLHMWQPHDGKPLSSLFFLDNHRTFSADVQFWKYALTGSDNNAELKIWSCESWSCLQTIRFIPNPNTSTPISLKAGIDLSAYFIILSDINNRVLYILQLQKDVEESDAHVCAVSELLLPNPILSFGIVDAGIRFAKPHDDASDDLEIDLNKNSDNSDGGDDDDEDRTLQVVIRMFVVHPKSLRGCIISYDPPKESKKTLSIYSDDCLRKEEPVNQTLRKKVYCEELSDISESTVEKIRSPTNTSQSSVNSTLALAGSDVAGNELSHLRQSSESVCVNNLMTPDDFSSPNEKNGMEVEKSSPLMHVSERLGEHLDVCLGEQSAEKVKQQADSSSKHEPPSHVSKIKGKNGKPMDESGLKRKQEATTSCGSSPSREVEEILSYGSNDCLSSTLSYGFPSGTVPETVSLTASAPPAPIKGKSPLERDQLAEAAASLKLDLVWNGKMSSKSEAASGSVEGPLSISIPTVHPASGLSSTTNALQAVVAAAQEKPVMVSAELLEKQQTQWSRVDLLLETLQQQQAEIKNLRQELGAIRLSQPSASDAASDKIQTLFKSQQIHLEETIQSTMKSTVQNTIQTILLQQETQRQEALLSAVTQTVSNLVTSRLPELISQEIKNEVVPIVKTTVQQMKQQMANEVATKLAATDTLLKDNIDKLVTNKPVLDMLCHALLTLAQPTIQSLYRESLSPLVPGMEKITQNMFHQINSAFSKGTQEYMQYVENNLDKQNRQAERVQEMLMQMQSIAESMQVSHEQQSHMLQSTLETQLQRLLNSLQDKLNKTVSDTVKGNLAQGFKQQKAVIEESVLTSLTAARSRAVSPAHSVTDYATIERRVIQLIQEGDFNAAFQQALSASNINLVVMACERVDPQVLFSTQPLPLKQNILLSLIQQLSIDLNDNTDLKRRYLEEAVMSLDQSDHDVRRHLDYIIGKLRDQLMAFINAHPNSQHSRPLKILYMAVSNIMPTPSTPS